MTDTSMVWFAAETGRNDQETAFLEGLRQRATTWHVDGLSPQDTSSQRWLAPLYVDVQVPKVTIPRRTLQIAYWTGGPYGQALHGVWGDDYLMDDHDGNDPEDLTVVGIQATAGQYAAWAADWLVRQLERPVVRHEWLRGGRVAATMWCLQDTGRVLGKTGISPRRLLRRPADRLVAIR
ncbi:hypothetical protein [Micromonospora sp. CPCC 206061]|uniref:hypothetical protein n=1 Tax=Micromonospora sp. CPCC 206061 TaxID=3122410 RepID=UPI002FF072B9